MMIFLSYASEQRRVAEKLCLTLIGDGHDVFWDKTSLPPGDEYDTHIREAIKQSDGLIFLISPHAVEDGAYARTELKFARQQWPHPAGCVLPVMAEPTALDDMPVYLTVVTILMPEGNLAAEVAAEVARRPFRPREVDVARTIGVVADSLSPNQFRSVPPERREAVAGYFDDVGECLYGVYKSLQQGEVPHGRCSELDNHAELLPTVVGDFIGADKAQELSGLLRAAHNVEEAVYRVIEGYHGLMNAADRAEKLPEIVKAAGKFNALSSAVRGGLGPMA